MPPVSCRAREALYPSVREMFEMSRGMDDVISFMIGEPGFDTPHGVIDAAHRAALAGDTHYTPNRGTVALRRAWCASRNQMDGTRYDPQSNVIITAGGMEGVFLAMTATMDPGDAILVPDPGYANYFGQAQMAGARVIPVPLRREQGFRMRAADVEVAVTTRTRALLLNSPSNPTGAVIGPDELARIAGVARRHDLWVISDEVYRAFVYDETVECRSIATMPGMAERTLVVDSFSKTYAMTGWRIGGVFGPGPAIDRMAVMQENLISCVPGALQAGAVRALEDADGILKDMKAAYRANRDAVVAAVGAMPLVSCDVPDGAFYVLLDVCGTGMDDRDFAVRLLHEAHVAVTPASGFGSRGEGYVRLSYVGGADDTREGLRRMQVWLETLRG